MEREGVFLRYGRIDSTFEKYGLWSAELVYENSILPWKAVIKDVYGEKKVIGFPSRLYQLLPNKLVVETAEEIAEELGLGFSEEALYKAFGRKVSRESWSRFVEDLKRGIVGVFYDGRYATRVYVNFVLPEPVEISGEEVLPGFQIRNSEDGSLSFGIDVLTYRVACRNGAIIPSHITLPIKVFWRHTEQLKPLTKKDVLMEEIRKVINLAKRYIEGYRLLAEVELSIEVAEKLAEKLPKTYLPKYIRAEEGRVELLKAPTLWEAYNDITRLIWWNHRTEMSTKRSIYRALHSVIRIPG
ncbi:MAG: DUF932 domain-containing protein [Nitrososphaerota archaeon]